MLRRALPGFVLRFAAQLDDLATYLDINFSRVFVWHPTAAEIAKLRFILRLRDGTLASRALAQSMEEASTADAILRSAKDRAQPSESIAADVATAGANLLERWGGSGAGQANSQSVAKAMAHSETLVKSDVIDALRTWGLALHDPIARSLANHLADVAAILHRLSPLIRDTVHSHRDIVGPGAERHLALTIGPYVHLIDRFMGLTKCLQTRRSGR
jgi:hypothetical protein